MVINVDLFIQFYVQLCEAKWTLCMSIQCLDIRLLR